MDKLSYNNKNIYYQKLENTFKFFDSQDLDFYYILENPELGFHPKSCMSRPFDIFPNQCRIKYEQYFQRQNEYRTNAIDLANKYKKIKILDPEKLYCDDKYCYAIKDGKMLYADDDDHSVDGSLEQAKYFMDDLISNEVRNAN
ncbi:SGNH hydrolase domain-containing protein [Halarcobacter sp.]|uniref:SGNH hydrolase domain-containing protein n=1 Tax=Halarcobacter sp. TaxID=2321133 RepID=UPI003A90C16D